MSTEKHIHRGTDRYIFDGCGGVREISKKQYFCAAETAEKKMCRELCKKTTGKKKERAAIAFY